MANHEASEGRSPAELTFAERYGPWALVAGASDGVGAAFARQVAERGVHVVLLARRRGVLEDLAAAIRAATGVEARVVVADLAAPDAMDAIAEATADLEIGLAMYCAGADPNYRHFLAEPVESALSMVQRNCVVPLAVCHHFCGPMADRGRGGIVVLSSGAGVVGAPNMVAYAATKAFDTVMAEALWAEVHDQGVDVLGLVLGMTDTPALRTLLARRGQLASPDDPSPIPGAVSAEEVAAVAIAELGHGPTAYASEDVRVGLADLGDPVAQRRQWTLMIQFGGAAMGPEPDDPEGDLGRPGGSRP